MSYSTHIVKRNAAANPTLLGVQLGQVCIAQGVPSSAVASDLSVSKVTIYKWFTGEANVSKHLRGSVSAYLAKLARKSIEP